jgi:hypothetical protein
MWQGSTQWDGLFGWNPDCQGGVVSSLGGNPSLTVGAQEERGPSYRIRSVPP